MEYKHALKKSQKVSSKAKEKIFIFQNTYEMINTTHLLGDKIYKTLDFIAAINGS